MRYLQQTWRSPATRVFLFLQLGDFLTTMLFMSRRISETNPLASYLMERCGTLAGLLILKGAAITVGLLCSVAAQPKFMWRINAIYVLFVSINILTLCTVKGS